MRGGGDTPHSISNKYSYTLYTINICLHLYNFLETFKRDGGGTSISGPAAAGSAWRGCGGRPSAMTAAPGGAKGRASSDAA